MTRPISCPSPDHTGTPVLADRHLDIDLQAGEHSGIAEAYCSYCADGVMAQYVRYGWRVTVWAV